MPRLPPLPTGGAAHDYFNALIARRDHWRAISFRPVPGDTNNQSPYWERQLHERDDGGFQSNGNGFNPPAITYSPSTDTDPNRQDAAKVVVVAYNFTTVTLTSAVTATDSVLHVTSSSEAAFNANREIRLEREVMTVVSRDEAARTLTVNRAQRGTSAAAHAAGVRLELGGNTVRNTIRWPLDELHTIGGTSPLSATDKLNRFLVTWDCLWTDSYVGTGLTNHKSFNLLTGDQSIWLEPNAGFSGGVEAVRGSFVNGMDVGAVYTRAYSPQYGPPVTGLEPIQPQLATFTIRPNRWMRYWYLINVLDIPASFLPSAATLVDAIGAADTAVTVDATGLGPSAGFFVRGTYLKLDDEILQCADNAVVVSGNIRRVTVRRGLKGTTAAAHAARANIAGAHSMHVSAWVADEDREPVQLYNDLPLTPRPSETNENALNEFIVEFNTSTETLRNRADRDLVAYVRNLAVLRSRTLDPPADGLLVRPVR